MDNHAARTKQLNARELDRLLELFLACREMDAEERAAWLHQACCGDVTLHHRVEALIREDASADGFLSHPMPFVTGAYFFDIAEGQKFGRYTITGFVGRGGMGEVWRAHDAELDRTVALKFMKAGFPLDQLTREARMASALNHPGIVTVHDVIIWEGTPVLVMELANGSPLSKFCDGLISPDQLIAVTTQVSGALAAAHADGIIHGDLKPDNIIWREDRLAKILDFGLAHKVEKGGAATVAGTLAYMSPEQARGDAAGTASDVYSLGLVLYELATGQRPFGRQSLQDTGSRHAKPLQPSLVRAGLPPALDDLIDRMLEPDPALRIRMQEVFTRLQQLGNSAPLPRSWKMPVLAASLILIGALLLFLRAADPQTVRNRTAGSSRLDLSRLTVRPLASQLGLEDHPSVSPDGQWISCLYRPREYDRPQLQVHSIQGGPPIVIDTGALLVQRPAAWSPDSGELVFSAREGGRERAIYRVSRNGVGLRRIAPCKPRSDYSCEVDWSPDGKTLVVTDRWPGNSELYLLDLASGQRRDLLQPVRPYVKRPRFSPDGKWIAYLKEASMTSDDLYVLGTETGHLRRLTESPWHLRGFSWNSDGKGVVAVSSHGSNKLQLWQFPVDGSQPSSLGELDAERSSDPSMARGRRILTWVRNLNANSLWRMPVDRTRGRPEPLVSSAAFDVDADWSSGGRVVFRSDRSGTEELWTAKADGTGVRQATRFRGPFVGDPHWSPDGQSIAFTSRVDGNPDIFVMLCDSDNAACGQPRQLTKTPASDANPTWSHDGRWIYFSSSRSGTFEVWRVPADGNAEAQRITWNEGYLARESKDGKWLYYSKLWPTGSFWRIALPSQGPGQTETAVAPKVPPAAGATWALGQRELFYYPATDDPAIPFPAIRAIDLITGRTRDLPLGSIRLSRGLTLSPDEQWLLRSQTDRAQTLVMIAE